MKGHAHSQFFADGLVVALLALACATAAVDAAAQPNEPRRVELSDVVSSGNGPLTAVKVSGLIDEKQSSKTGLRFTLVLLNTGSTPLTILDPTELSQPQLLTSDGWPVELRQIVPGWRIRRETPKTIVLQPSQEYRVPIAVTQILGNQQHVPSSSTQSTARGGGPAPEVPIPAGQYKVKMHVLLGSAGTGAAATRSRTLESPEVLVTLEP